MSSDVRNVFAISAVLKPQSVFRKSVIWLSSDIAGLQQANIIRC